MQGQQHYQHKIIHQIDLEILIPAHHLLRRIDRVVDFSFIRALTAPFYCQNNGRPSIDPEVFFRLVLISYFYNIRSDRQLCEEVQYNLAYRWFCKLNLEDKVPDHSSLTVVRNRLGVEIFQQFFQEILSQCQQQGLVKAKRIMTDATLIYANASLNSLTTKAPHETNKQQQQSACKNRKLGTQPARAVSNETHYSRTDPDATLSKKRGAPIGLKYKAHLSIDADSRVVVATQVTTGAVHESQVYLAQLDVIQRLLTCFIQIVIADRGYGSGKILQALLQHSRVPVIPLFNSRSGGFVVKEEQGFYYEAEHDRYRCPTGNYLIPFKASTETVKYHSQNKVCTTCPQRMTCPTKRLKFSHIRFVCRNIYQAVYEYIEQQSVTEEFRAQQNERFWKMEGVISEAKNRQGLARARYRGLTNMQIQAYLSASAQNIKRLIAFFMFVNFYYTVCWRYELLVHKIKIILIHGALDNGICR